MRLLDHGGASLTARLASRAADPLPHLGQAPGGCWRLDLNFVRWRGSASHWPPWIDGRGCHGARAWCRQGTGQEQFREVTLASTVPVSPMRDGPVGPWEYHHDAREVPCAVLLRAKPLPPNVAGSCHGRPYRCGGPRRRAGAVSDPSVTSGQPSLAVRIETEKSNPLAWKTVAKRAVVVLIAGVSIYLVFPAITEVFASWPRLSTLDPRWFAVAVGAEIAHFICTFALQRLALRTRAWFPVVTSLLAGNAITLIMPGGAAVGAAVQFRMLATSGSDTDSTVGGLAAFSLLGVGGLLALPVFALPVILLGAPTNRGLVNAAVLGAAGFVIFAALGAVILAYDAPLRWAGRAAQRVRNWTARS